MTKGISNRLGVAALILIAQALMFAGQAYAQAWFSGDCTMQNGEKIVVFVSGGEARISYNGETPHMAFPEYKDGVMSVVHIGGRASFILSMTVSTGRAYGIMITDKGGRHEYNAICKTDVGRR
jgi:hypothetical protein